MILPLVMVAVVKAKRDKEESGILASSPTFLFLFFIMKNIREKQEIEREEMQGKGKQAMGIFHRSSLRGDYFRSKKNRAYFPSHALFNFF